MAGLACSGSRGAASIAAASSSSSSHDPYNRDDARRYLRWWKGTRDLYFKAIREVGRLRLCLEATQTHPGGCGTILGCHWSNRAVKIVGPRATALVR